MEEINKESIEYMLEEIPVGLSQIERILLTNENTVQTLLSVIFNTPIDVIILHQVEVDRNTFIRWSKLVAANKTVCIAQSYITTDNEGFATGIKEQNIGIGQLIAAKCLITRRTIKKMYSDTMVFSRIYQIEDVGMTPNGSHINCLITEVFPKLVFSEACIEWNQSYIKNSKTKV